MRTVGGAAGLPVAGEAVVEGPVCFHGGWWE